jgi:hypothetical protein
VVFLARGVDHDESRARRDGASFEPPCAASWELHLDEVSVHAEQDRFGRTSEDTRTRGDGWPHLFAVQPRDLAEAAARLARGWGHHAPPPAALEGAPCLRETRRLELLLEERGRGPAAVFAAAVDAVGERKGRGLVVAGVVVRPRERLHGARTLCGARIDPQQRSTTGARADVGGERLLRAHRSRLDEEIRGDAARADQHAQDAQGASHLRAAAPQARVSLTGGRHAERT